MISKEIIYYRHSLWNLNLKSDEPFTHEPQDLTWKLESVISAIFFLDKHNLETYQNRLRGRRRQQWELLWPQDSKIHKEYLEKIFEDFFIKFWHFRCCLLFCTVKVN